MDFLKDAIKRFRYYKELADNTFEQLEDRDLFWQPDPGSNSIAVIQDVLFFLFLNFTHGMNTGRVPSESGRTQKLLI